MRYTTVYPSLLPQQYYIMSICIGFFIWKEPLYASLVLFFVLLFCSYSLRVRLLSLGFAFIGFVIAYMSYTTSTFPTWYTSKEVYSINATISSISYGTGNRSIILLKNITPTAHVIIQNISKKKPCTVKEGGHILYEKARSCAVSYPITTTESLPEYGIFSTNKNIANVYEGKTLSGTFSIENIRSQENGHFSLKEYYNEKKIRYRVQHKKDTPLDIHNTANIFGTLTEYTQKTFRESFARVQNTIDSSVQEHVRAIANALLLGNRYYFSKQLEENLVNAGLLHSVVLSGMHVSSLIIFAFPLVWLLLRLFPKSIIHIPKQYALYIFLILFALAYGAISNFPLSYTRAVLMLIVAFFFSYSHSRYTLLDILFYSIACIFIMSPEVIYTLSFQLSCGAVFAIYIISPFITRSNAFIDTMPIPRGISFLLKLFSGIIYISFAINLVISPLLLSSFGVLPHAIFLNLVWLPLLSFFILPLLFCSFVLSLLGIHIDILWILALTPIEYLLYFLHFLQQQEWFEASVQMRPHPYTTASLYIAIFALMQLVNKRVSRSRIYVLSLISFILLCVPIIMRLYPYYTDTLALHVLDVGKGQALLVEHGRKRILIDAGERTPYFDAGKSIVNPILTYNQHPHLESIILTHQDSDHIGGAIFLSKQYTINTLYHNGDTTKATKTVQELFTKTKHSTKVLSEGDTVYLAKDIYLDILLPSHTMPLPKKDDSNALSIVAMLMYKGRSIALLLGDITIEGQRYLLEKYGSRLECEAIVLPHHGSKHNVYMPLYKATKARYAFVSTHTIDSNFVAPALVQQLESLGMLLYTTYTNGKISLIVTSKKESTIQINTINKDT